MNVTFKHAALAAAVLTLSLASCSNQEEPFVGPSETAGLPTAIGLVISSPEAPQTYAADANATASETKLTAVDVFIYKNSITGYVLEQTKSLSISADFTETPTGSNEYTLNAGSKIQTTTGDKRIYVSVNTPASIASSLPADNTPESQLIGLVATLTSDTELADPTNGFAMFSTDASSTTLVKESDPSYATDNTVTATVARLVAKISVKEDAGLRTGGDIVAQGGWVKGLEFTVCNNSDQTYLLQHKAGNIVSSPWGTGTPTFFAAPATPTFQAVDAAGATVAAGTINPVYVTENAVFADASVALGEGVKETYASIRSKYVPAYYCEDDGTAKATANNNTTAAQTFWTVSLSDGTFCYFETEAEADTFLGNNTSLTPVKSEYIDGYCYWRAYFNPNATDNAFGVLRNVYYDATIMSITGPGAASDANVGSATLETTLLMKVNVKLWDSSSQNWTLN